jgi:hypothetical protein
VLCETTIYNIIRKLHSTGLVLDKNKCCMYRLKKNFRTLGLDKEQARRSCYVFWLFSVGLQKYSSDWHKVAKVATVIHSLLPPDSKARIRYCKRFQEPVLKGVLNTQLMFYSDKVWLTLSSYVNSQNNKYWSTRVFSFCS